MNFVCVCVEGGGLFSQVLITLFPLKPDKPRNPEVPECPYEMEGPTKIN